MGISGKRIRGPPFLRPTNGAELGRIVLTDKRGEHWGKIEFDEEVEVELNLGAWIDRVDIEEIVLQKVNFGWSP